jgi:hypothetical protein
MNADKNAAGDLFLIGLDGHALGPHEAPEYITWAIDRPELWRNSRGRFIYARGALN